MSNMRLSLPPASLTGPVKVWSEPLRLPTYEPMPADRNPMFLEKRVYQGSSGRVYPLPFTDRISQERTVRDWQAVHLENEFLRLTVLPELGGRIYAAVDKINGYDFIYRNPVIKPALVGLAGPWISGGIEFNWPQHHRPSTYMPVEVAIETEADGGVTIWLGEHEPMNRMKGMHGVRLRPGRAYLDVRVRLFNRTPLPQTFMWWANVATDVSGDYQSFFPDDVHHVADHARRALSSFPFCSGRYYGIDYGARAAAGGGAPADGRPDDLRWYRNIPVPTSYMCVGGAGDFFGGYDHKAEAGIVHYADHHIAPGKKQWTWGCDAFGRAWDRNLTEPDDRGVWHPYFELMAGVYTDNQPDFSFIAPGETRTFSQYWYPIRKIGPVRAANLQAAIGLGLRDGAARLGVQALQAMPAVVIALKAGNTDLARWCADLAPEAPFLDTVSLPPAVGIDDLSVTVCSADGLLILTLEPEQIKEQSLPETASEPPLPNQIATAEDLFLTGLHLAQYRHATRAPEDYWREALRRDPLDSRCNNAMGLWHFRRGELAESETSFRHALQRLQSRNPNPYDGEAFYNLGLTLRYLGRPDEAYAAFYKAIWNAAWRSPARLMLAEIDAGRERWEQALEHVEDGLRHDGDNLRGRAVKAVCLRKLQRQAEASTLLRQTLALDPLDHWTADLTGRPFDGDGQSLLDLALDYAGIGLFDRAYALLDQCPAGQVGSAVEPLVHYHAALMADRLGRPAEADRHRQAAAAAAGDHCFPSRLEDMIALQAAIAARPTDAKASYYLGNILYDRRRYHEAILCWQASVETDSAFSIAWRNLGIGYFNILKRPDLAAGAYERAFLQEPGDGRLLYERDQLWKRIGRKPEDRLDALQAHPALVEARDDLSVELCSLLTHLGRPGEALRLLQSRQFQPWEGGEGQALAQYVRARLALGRDTLRHGDAGAARAEFAAALATPTSLGEAAHPLANQSNIHYWLGLALRAAGRNGEADHHWRLAADRSGDFQDMELRRCSEKTFYSALALRALGREGEAAALFQEMAAFAEAVLASDCKIDYFATSLPTMLIFEDDVKKRRDLSAHVIAAQALAGQGRTAEAGNRLRQVLAADPNQADAADLGRMLDEAAAMDGRADGHPS